MLHHSVLYPPTGLSSDLSLCGVTSFLSFLLELGSTFFSCGVFRCYICPQSFAFFTCVACLIPRFGIVFSGVFLVTAFDTLPPSILQSTAFRFAIKWCLSVVALSHCLGRRFWEFLCSPVLRTDCACSRFADGLAAPLLRCMLVLYP